MTGTTPDPEFESLLEFLKENRGFDFTGYKRSTLERRVRKRMDEAGVGSYPEYREHLEANPDEFTALFNTILINVTGFFRDLEAWETLSRDFLPRLLERRAGDAQVRVWSAGCASGEEAYTLVMALSEAMGMDAFRARVKIYATDVDEEALQQARQAVYPPKALEAVPEALRERYFEHRAGKYVFRSDLRRLVIFGRHDLVRDAPMSHLDLLVSRNALMYFNAETQTRILNRFHFALAEGGILFMGKAEMMRSHASLFASLDLKARIFGKAQRATPRERLLAMASPPREAVQAARGQVRLRDAALDAAEAAQLVVSPAGTVVLANAPARALFALSADDVGRPLKDLPLSYRPVELRSRIDQASHERRPLHVAGVEIPGPEGVRSFDLHVKPLVADDALLGVSVEFLEVTRYQRLQAELQETNQELETAFEELQSTNEELETTNEELQSTIEELETTNEEFQSTNEELETMNEELQSTNEELETLNDELHRRTGELNEVNAYMRAILTSLRLAVVVVDRGSDIRVWNRRAEDLWGLRGDEVEGHAFQNLDIGLPVERLKTAIRECIDGRTQAEEMTLDAVNRRGRAIRCRVTCSPFVDGGPEARGAVLVMEELRPAEDGDGDGADPSSRKSAP
jgi:two-component system CheB/CheR fusion protein